MTIIELPPSVVSVSDSKCDVFIRISRRLWTTDGKPDTITVVHDDGSSETRSLVEPLGKVKRHE